MKKLFFLFGTAALLASCGNDKTSEPATSSTTTTTAPAATASLSDADRKAIDEGHQSFMKNFPAGDSAAVAALYASDAQVFPPNMPATDAKGMGSVSKGFATMKPDRFELHGNEVVPAGDLALVSGTWTLHAGGKEADKGKFMEVWKKEGSAWKIWRDIWNSDNAPAAH